MASDDEDVTDLAYDLGYEAGRATARSLGELLEAGYGDGTFEDRGSLWAHVPAATWFPDERFRFDWAIGYAHALEDLADGLTQRAGVPEYLAAHHWHRDRQLQPRT